MKMQCLLKKLFIIALGMNIGLYAAEVRTLAEWTIIVYMQADNNLSSFADYNIKQMQQGIVKDSSQVNVLVQWDQPENNKTWRYKILKGNKIDVGSLNIEMGLDPERELVDCARWVKDNYPAKKYAWILWNHGSGIQDIKARISFLNSWIQIPGLSLSDDRGILYDDSQHSFLSNQALRRAFAKITDILGHPIDVLAMDACLMAMIEVSYQIKGLASYMVASEQIEQGTGYAYDRILNPLTQDPMSFDDRAFAELLVHAYKSYYDDKGETDYTISAFDMHYIDALKENIDNFVLAVAACKKFDRNAISHIIIKARKKALSFATADFIDVHNFYSYVLKYVTVIRENAKANTSYVQALDRLAKVLEHGKALITKSVCAQAVGLLDSKAQGISIYYLDVSHPASAIDKSYVPTLFAQESLWLNFVKENRL